ncbi:MAG TPA: hypothetical protein VK358_16525, partial [Longimicrobium sp.]|nr:hypothetical protein [Longimicrobium sp.]
AVVGIVGGLVAGVVGAGEYEREALGVVLGGVPALLLEYRFVRDAPVRRPLGVAMVLAGIVPLALVHRLGDAHWAGLLLIAVAMLWSVLVVSVILRGVRWPVAARATG